MKRSTLTILVFLSTLSIFSQLKIDDIIISADGNYIKTNAEYGVTTNENQTKPESLNLGTSIGIFITNNVLVGAGLDYYWDKETRTNYLNFNKFMQYESMKIKSTAIIPNIYIGYYHRIVDKLYFSGKLKLSYGKIKSEFHTEYAGIQGLPSDITTVDAGNSNYVKISNEDSESYYFETEISPEFTYFFSPRFGLSLGLGGAKYSSMQETDESNWLANFNPSFWKLGVKFKI